MAKTKKSETDTASIVEEKTTVETEKPVVEENKPAEKPSTEGKQKEKPIADDDKIIIQCKAYAGKSISLPTRVVELDDKGCCEVTGIEAKRLLTIPGYERAK